MVSRVGKVNKKGFQPEIEHFSATWAWKALHQSNCPGSFLGPLHQLAFVVCFISGHCRRTSDPHPFMEKRNQGNSLRRSQLIEKYGDLIAKSAKWMELERERERARIAKAALDDAAAEQNLLDSDSNERARKKRSAIRQQLLFKKTGRRVPRRAMDAMTKAVEIADETTDSALLAAETSKLAGSSSPTVLQLEDATVHETQADVDEFLKSVLQSPVSDKV